MFENQNTYPATISTVTTVGANTNIFFASNKFLLNKTITGISVYPFMEYDSGLNDYVGVQLFGTQAPFQFTSLTVNEIAGNFGNISYTLNLVNDNDELVLSDIPLNNFIVFMNNGETDFTLIYGDIKIKQQIFKLKNINLEKSYITGGMEGGKGIYFVFNYM